LAEAEGLERGLVVAGLNALREVGGEALVQIILGQVGSLSFSETGADTDRVPLEDYLTYRDTVLEFLGDSFSTTAFETGRQLVRSLKHQKQAQVVALVGQFRHAKNKLPLIGQAAVLAAKGNPGTVRAAMKGTDTLVITIAACPECRRLQRSSPFCYLNQGVITEFAEAHLGLAVSTRETRCMAMSDPHCEIEVTLRG
jgi:predicted hydrocarbon binding protein